MTASIAIEPGGLNYDLDTWVIIISKILHGWVWSRDLVIIGCSYLVCLTIELTSRHNIDENKYTIF